MSSVPWLKNTLDIAGSHYKEDQHPKAFTAQEMAQHEHVSGHRVAKTVAVEADGRVFLLVLPASRKVSLDRVRRLASAKSIRLLSEGEIGFHFPDCEVGAVPPMRHWPNIDLWMDASLMGEGEIVFHGGSHTDAIRMPFAEWFAIAKPKQETFSVSDTRDAEDDAEPE